MRLDRSIDNGDVDFVMHDVGNRGHELGRSGDRRLPGFEIDLQRKGAAELLERRAEFFHRIALLRKKEAAAEAEPFQLGKQPPVALRNDVEAFGEMAEIVVLAVEMEHGAADKRHDGAQLVCIGDAEPAVAPRRVGRIKTGEADAGIDPQADSSSPVPGRNTA